MHATNFHAHGRTAGAWGIASKVPPQLSLPPWWGKVGMGGGTLGSMTHPYLFVFTSLVSYCILCITIEESVQEVSANICCAEM